jgi:hypothetical protein
MANFSAFVMRCCDAFILQLAVHDGNGEGGIRTLVRFLRSILRSGKILLQNRANVRNAARI